eukprot:1284847-Prymnesium_polylepis.1
MGGGLRAREVARHRQAHADDRALGRRVSNLARLPVEGGDRSGVDDAAALAVSIRLALRHALRRQPRHVERARDVHLQDALEWCERVRVALLADRLGG